MSEVEDVVKPIGFRIVRHAERKKFLIDLCGGNIMASLEYENRIFGRMHRTTPNYGGGGWHFVEFENGARAMVFKDELDKLYPIHPQANFFEKPMSLLNLCVALNICVCSDMAWNTPNHTAQLLSRNYHLLREVADTLPDGQTIFGFID